jgi:hypothetical protein
MRAAEPPLLRPPASPLRAPPPHPALTLALNPQPPAPPNQEVRDSVVSIFSERKNMAQSLKDTDSIVRSLEFALGAIMHFIFSALYVGGPGAGWHMGWGAMRSPEPRPQRRLPPHAPHAALRLGRRHPQGIQHLLRNGLGIDLRFREQRPQRVRAASSLHCSPASLPAWPQAQLRCPACAGCLMGGLLLLAGRQAGRSAAVLRRLPCSLRLPASGLACGWPPLPLPPPPPPAPRRSYEAMLFLFVEHAYDGGWLERCSDPQVLQ